MAAPASYVVYRVVGWLTLIVPLRASCLGSHNRNSILGMLSCGGQRSLVSTIGAGLLLSAGLIRQVHFVYESDKDGGNDLGISYFVKCALLRSIVIA